MKFPSLLLNTRRNNLNINLKAVLDDLDFETAHLSSFGPFTSKTQNLENYLPRDDNI